ncbi:hypothetical protein Rhopal_002131-T1 [Rhodotorula paludigena]|uniref:DUF2461 domain-containing protein n=1 Tax=Rhodotorula paludigena TaxID=86838 RepID=A0AAV5GIJ7_9BASI|nr:hypothetical protein Rhopal_002131-T1 [Rhodotorula paludigena]
MAAKEGKATKARKASDDASPRKRARKVATPSSDDDAGSSGVEDTDSGDSAPTQKGKGKSRAKPAKKVKGKAKKGKKSDSEDDFIDDGDEDEEDGDDSGDDVKTRVVGSAKKVPAPKSKADVPIILPETLDFLKRLSKHNDRDWFQLHDNEYRHALLNFTTFVQHWVPLASEADWQLPHLPAKDLMHRIYRDVRFSKDKTPYKTYFCASHSRTGRKGPFALYYVHIQPGGKSMLGCGCWQPPASSLKLFRDAILRDPKPLRKVLAAKDFVELFGSDKPRMDNKRSSIFGGSDQLKNAPKLEGVDKTHKDIDLLKCRSFAVETYFPDDVVTSDGFLQKLKHAIEVASPFTQLLNEIISPSPASDNDEDEDDGEEDGEDGEDTEGDGSGEGDEDEEED